MAFPDIPRPAPYQQYKIDEVIRLISFSWHSSMGDPLICPVHLKNADFGVLKWRPGTFDIRPTAPRKQPGKILHGVTQKPCYKRCQLVLTNMIMVNTHTKIKCNIFPPPLHKFRSKNDVIPSYDVMLHTMSSAVPEKKKKWIRNQDKIDFTFSLDSNLGVHSPYNPDLILPPVPFGIFF